MDDLSQYLPTWQQDGRGLGATSPEDNPPMAPAYGQPQPDGVDLGASVAPPPPFSAQPAGGTGGSLAQLTTRMVVVSGGVPTASTQIVFIPSS